jgi:TonB family protein
MGRFFVIISAIFHGTLLLLLLSWEVPLADRLLPKNTLEVSLVEKVEETNLPKTVPRIFKKPEKMRTPEKGEILRAPEKKEARKEEKREEKVDPAQAILKEERRQADDPIPPENKALKDPVERSFGAQAKTNPLPPEGGNPERLESLPEGKGGPGAKEGSGSAFLASAASLVGLEGIGLGGGGIPGRAKGEGTPGQMANIHHSPGGDSDPIHSLILRKIEAAKRYPRVARKMGIEGTAVVRFKLKPEGRVEAVEVVDSSGSEILDKASLETVHADAPFPYKAGWLKVGIDFKIF